ncbi:hypothetical protein [Pseudoalteromonas sp. G4]|uniref:hypothetical protein n=1 Tax=Pseudoalteromonas sp. G4 TaxID=2992761 RepID=UPI00237EDFFF|nr:hypothetical protein [Pseudoalteromonas sp. G4]MDE3271392.1 SUN domain-containing protein [Pseudoalteromonas sp. G4]
MKKTINNFLSLCLVSTTFLSNASTLTQVHVDAGEIGQGFLVSRLNNCYLITPKHVLGEDFFATILTGTSKRSLGEAEKVQTFGYDLSISLVSGAAATECNTDINSFKPINNVLKNTTNVSISTINSDGSKSFIPASLIDLDLINFKVKSNAGEPLYKGLSGSTIFSQGTPIGILQSVDSQSGEGKALRMDRAIETINPFFTSSSFSGLSSQEKGKIDKVNNLNKIEYKITEWSHSAIGSDFRINHINDNNLSSQWVVNPNNNAIELTLDFNGELKVINSVSFNGNITDKSSMPKNIQILSTRRASGKRGWASIFSGTWINNDEQFEAKLSPVKAKRIKIIFASNWGNKERLTLSEISVF